MAETQNRSPGNTRNAQTDEEGFSDCRKIRKNIHAVYKSEWSSIKNYALTTITGTEA